MPPNLQDQAARDRFITTRDRNFSVIAPAGVGKTSSIVERLVHGASAGAGLARMAVVTYTRKAAVEMRERTRNRLVEQHPTGHGRAALDEAFFGTIHGFCVDLLRRFGPEIGIPAAFDVDTDGDAAWDAFLRDTDDLARILPEEHRRFLLQHLALPQAIDLARSLALNHVMVPEPPAGAPDPPVISQFPEILAYAETDRRSIRSATEAQARIERYLAHRAAGEFCGFPDFDKGSRAFRELYGSALQPLHDQLADLLLRIAIPVAHRFREFRMARARLLFADQVHLAAELLADPPTARIMRAQAWHVLLDEAQDTDPLQFRVLTEITRPPDATGIWIEGAESPPLPGRFCMVGDPQQSIYSSRADLGTYRQIHRRLTGDHSGESVTLSVTRRCDHAIVDCTNALFTGVLDGSGGQVDYVHLTARPDASPGSVRRLHLEPVADETGNASGIAGEARQAAAALTAWLASHTAADCGTSDWSQVALLCPRNDWLLVLADSLRQAGLPVQLHARGQRRGDNPGFAWPAAILRIVAHPEDHFEIYGVLREVFGIDDHTLVTASTTRLNLLEEPAPGIDRDLAASLQSLREIRRCFLEDGIGSGFRRLIAESGLEEALDALPADTGKPALRELEALRRVAVQAEADRVPIEAWVEQLEELADSAPEPTPPEPGHLQLLTSHGAKGLEWDVVILPFFFRQVGFLSGQYPLAQADPDSGNVTVLLSSRFDRKGLLSRRKTANREELGRLLYVSFTRARNHLILCDDSAAFSRPQGSSADILGLLPGSANATEWNQLPLWEPTGGSIARDAPEPPSDDAVPADALQRIESLREIADRFLHTVAPSSLGHEPDRDEPDQRDTAGDFPQETLRRAAAAYGNWWHDSMEHLPWGDPAASREFMETALTDCPDALRGQSEWKRLSQSPWGRSLLDGSWIVRATEYSFALPRPEENQLLGGFIDLLVELPDHSLRVIDWKTDRTREDDPSALLRQRYAPQILAYRAVVAQLHQRSVSAGIYSTSHGIGVILE